MQSDDRKLRSVYEEYPIRTGMIRLIILQTALQVGDPIECGLKVHSLDGDMLKYEALSYTWGPPYLGQIWTDDPDFKYEGYGSPDRTTSLCGRPKAIQGNLFDALHQFRREARSRLIWIDALCINQQDPLKRSQQVSMMAKIYHRASTVRVWLGRDSQYADASTVMPLYCTLADREAELTSFLQDLERSGLKGSNTEDWSQHDERLRHLCVSHDVKSPLFAEGIDDKISSGWFRERTPKRWRAIYKGRGRSTSTTFVWQSLSFFVRRVYFSRRWVLQELYQARHAVISYAPHEMEWNQFRSVHGGIVSLMHRSCAPSVITANMLSQLFGYSLGNPAGSSPKDPILAPYDRMRAFAAA